MVARQEAASEEEDSDVSDLRINKVLMGKGNKAWAKDIGQDRTRSDESSSGDPVYPRDTFH